MQQTNDMFEQQLGEILDFGPNENADKQPPTNDNAIPKKPSSPPEVEKKHSISIDLIVRIITLLGTVFLILYFGFRVAQR